MTVVPTNAEEAARLDVETPLDCLMQFMPPSQRCFFSNALSLGENIMYGIDDKCADHRDPGSITNEIPDKLYVFWFLKEIEEVNQVHDGMYIISTQFRDFLLKHVKDKSEYFPVTLVLAPKNDGNPGMGQILEEGYWLWYHYDRQNLVDKEKSDARLVRWTDSAYVKNPEAVHWPDYITDVKRLVLRELPYELPLFAILGLAISSGRFVSPWFRDALAEVGFLKPDGPVSLTPYYLDEERRHAIGVARLRKWISMTPDLHVAGTDWIVPHDRVPPFTSRPLGY